MMKLFFLFIVATVIPAIADPYILNLFETASSEGKDPCWSESGFNSKLCNSLKTKCSATKKFYGSAMGKVNLESIPRYRDDYRLNYYLADADITVSRYEIKNNEFPLNSQLVVFQKDFSPTEHSLKIIGQTKVDGTSGIKPNEGSLLQATIIKFPDNLRAGESFRIKVLGEEFHFNPTARYVKFNLSPGTYQFQVYKEFDEKKLEGKIFTTTINSPVTRKEKIIEILEKGFQPAANLEHLRINQNNNSFKAGFSNSSSGKKYIFNFSSIFIPELSKDNMSHFFKISFGDLIMNSDGLKKISASKTSSNLFTLKLEGECGEAEVKRNFQYKVFADASEKQILGMINITSSDSGYPNISFKDSLGKHHEVKKNIDFSSCGGEEEGMSRTVVSYIAREVSGPWGNLGKGPWGERGWINVSYTDLYDYRGTFLFGALGGISLKSLGNGNIKVSGSPIQYEDKGKESNDKVEVTIPQEFLWNRNGEFNLRLDC